MRDTKTLLLASKSPRRRELLKQIGTPFETVDVNVPEIRQAGEAAPDYVRRLALSKARAGAKLWPGRPVLGADTVVVQGGMILEKPADAAAAAAMLALLSDNTHEVLTALAVCQDHREVASLCCSRVTFRAVSAAEAARYWRTGEPKDKAGGYGIQGLGAVFVADLHGSYSNVVGLPLMETQQLLAQFGVPTWYTDGQDE